jgi:hypothetical protein
LRVLRLPGIAFGKPLSAQNVARHWLWNERASQYAITLRFATRNVALARKDPLIRVFLFNRLWNRIDADIGGHGQNAGHRCVQKGMTGIWGALATRHPGVSAAPSLHASDEKIVADLGQK